MSIRLGIIGTGRIASRAVSEIEKVDGLKITAVVNPNQKHARDFADKYGIDNAFEGIEKLMGVADAAYVASPHGTHFGYTHDLLNMGLHVICEKPISLNPEHARSLYCLAAEKELVLVEGIKTAYCPGFIKLEEVLSSDVIGDVVDIEAAFTRLTATGCREYEDRKFGGSFTEFGTYTMLPIFRFLGTEYKNISFISKNIGFVDGYTKAVFDFGDRFACAKTGLSVKSEGQLLISGTKGYILVPSPWWLTRYFEVRYEDPKKIDRYKCEFDGDGLRYEFTEFVRRINEGISIPDKEIDEGMARAGVFGKFLTSRMAV